MFMNEVAKNQDSGANLSSEHALMRNSWAVPLKELVSRISTRKQVSLLFTTFSYLNSTLNWLIAAAVRCQPPVTNTIVVCYDQASFNVLNERDIPSVYIDPNTLIEGDPITHWKQFLSGRRLFLLRLVNHWGYDVVQYDADAIIIKNPQELFDQHPHSDIVISAGQPRNLPDWGWGFFVCMGVALFRSSPRTGEEVHELTEGGGVGRRREEGK
jgi:hypothetical protein